MAGKITLPHPTVVEKWKEEKVIKWLKRVHLEDCIPAFEARHISGGHLLELSEQKLFRYQDLKIKHRKQIAKCVQECKSQASNAKRIAKSIKQNHNHLTTALQNGGAYDSDDSDDWGTDFDDDDDDEVKVEETAELNNNTINSFSTDSMQEISSETLSRSAHGKFIPKPPDLPVISSAVNGSNMYRTAQHSNSIPRPPLKRPPSQPPPPPVPQTSNKDGEHLEEYEVPIIVQSNIVTSSATERETFSFFNVPYKLSSRDASVIETYEIIEPIEEDYEMVDDCTCAKGASALTSISPSTSWNSIADRPMLPPRIPLNPSLPSLPPVPQKPPKLHDRIQERPEGVRTFSRPKLPMMIEEEAQEGSNVSTSAINTTFLTSLLGRRISTPVSSLKTQHQSRDGSDRVLIITSSTDSQSSRSSSPEREVSATITSLSSSNISIEAKEPLPPPPPLPPRGALDPDDTAQNMATRPLPPVPLPKSEDTASSKLEEASAWPWFWEMEREDAERVVHDLLQSGSFLVRPGRRAGAANPYSLTILHEGRLFHLNIRQRPDGAFALGREKQNEKSFKCVADLISYHQTDPILLTSRGEPAGTTLLSKFPKRK